MTINLFSIDWTAFRNYSVVPTVTYLVRVRDELQVVRRVHGHVHGLVHRVPVGHAHRHLNRYHAHAAYASYTTHSSYRYASAYRLKRR